MSESRDQKPSGTELGMGIAALVIGVITTLVAIPAGREFHGNKETMFVLIALVPFALIASVLGLLGKKSPMGVAGAILGLLAIVECGLVVGYFEYKDAKEQTQAAAERKENEERQEREKQRQLDILKQQQQNEEAQRQDAERRERQRRADVAAEEKRRSDERAAQLELEKVRLAAESEKQRADAERTQVERERLEKEQREADAANVDKRAAEMAEEKKRKEAEDQKRAEKAKLELQTRIEQDQKFAAESATKLLDLIQTPTPDQKVIDDLVKRMASVNFAPQLKFKVKDEPERTIICARIQDFGEVLSIKDLSNNVITVEKKQIKEMAPVQTAVAPPKVEAEPAPVQVVEDNGGGRVPRAQPKDDTEIKKREATVKMLERQIENMQNKRRDYENSINGQPTGNLTTAQRDQMNADYRAQLNKFEKDLRELNQRLRTAQEALRSARFPDDPNMR